MLFPSITMLLVSGVTSTNYITGQQEVLWKQHLYIPPEMYHHDCTLLMPRHFMTNYLERCPRISSLALQQRHLTTFLPGRRIWMETGSSDQHAYQTTTDAEDSHVRFLGIDMPAVETVAQIRGRLLLRGPDVHHRVLSSKEACISTQVQLEDLPVCSELVMCSKSSGLQRCLQAPFPPSEVMRVRENFSKLIHSDRCDYFVRGELLHQGLCNRRQKAQPDAAAQQQRPAGIRTAAGAALAAPARGPVTAGGGGLLPARPVRPAAARPRHSPPPGASAASSRPPAGERWLPRRARLPPQGQDPRAGRRLCCRSLTLPGVEADSPRRGDEQGEGAQQSRQPPRPPHGSLRGGRARGAPGPPPPQRPPAARAGPAPHRSSMRSAPLLVSRRLRGPAHARGKPPRAPAPSPPAPRLRFPSSLSAAGVGEGGPSLPVPASASRAAAPVGRRGDARYSQAGPSRTSGRRGPGPPPGHGPPRGGGQLPSAAWAGAAPGSRPRPAASRPGCRRRYSTREVSLQSKYGHVRSLATPHSHRERQRPCREIQRCVSHRFSITRSPRRSPALALSSGGSLFPRLLRRKGMSRGRDWHHGVDGQELFWLHVLCVGCSVWVKSS